MKTFRYEVSTTQTLRTRSRLGAPVEAHKTVVRASSPDEAEEIVRRSIDKVAPPLSR